MCCLNEQFVSNFSNFWNPDEQTEDNEEEIERFSGRDGVLFLIDARTIANDEEQFRSVLSLIETTSMNRIIQSEKDLVWQFLSYGKGNWLFIL